MPINIIQPQPNFNTLLAQQLGKTFGQIGTGAVEGYGQAQKQQGISALLKQHFPELEESELNQISRSGVEAKDIMSMMPQIMKARETQQAQREAQQAKREHQQKADNSIKALRDNMDVTGMAVFSGLKPLAAKLPWTNSARRKEEFDTEAIWATDAAFSQINRGVLSDKKLALVIDKLTPNSELTQARNMGRINTLERLISSKKPLSDKQADSIIRGIDSLDERNPKKSNSKQQKSFDSIWEQ